MPFPPQAASAPPQTPAHTPSAPADRFCDLVMNGGITSGVVFPKAVSELAKSYRFHSIAGTSAGAMAAAVAAAAEYGRRLSGSDRGFVALARISTRFGDDVSRRVCGHNGPMTRLRSMFQPQPATRRLFNVMLAGLERKTAGARAGGIGVGILRQYAGPALLGALAAGLIVAVVDVCCTAQGLIAYALAGLTGGAVFIVEALLRDVARGLVPNGFGLCTGMPGDPASGKTEALVPWLHKSIQRLAGRKPNDRPLTFADLHRAPGFPPPWRPPSNLSADKSIVLKVVTTNVTHGRPYTLPLDGETARLFYDPVEWAAYFPLAVLEHLNAHSKPYAPKSASECIEPAACNGNAHLRELPGADLPIVVAARLSLSFPLLFSAVPLWAIDQAHDGGAPQLRRCWFSDGGISANFPIHQFDSAVPQWPTFGIQLTSRRREAEGSDASRVWLPQRHLDGIEDEWDAFDRRDQGGRAPPPLRRLVGYLVAIVLAAKDWNDNTLARMPGVRDRIVRVALENDKEGGLNLNMPRARINDLVGWGSQAAQALTDKFAPIRGQHPITLNPTSRNAAGWDEHRWVRLNSTLYALRRTLDRVGSSLAGNRYATPVAELITEALVTPPLSAARPGDAVAGPAAPNATVSTTPNRAQSTPPELDTNPTLSAAQADALQQLVKALQAAELAFSAVDATAQPYRPTPEPQLRVRPPG